MRGIPVAVGLARESVSKTAAQADRQEAQRRREEERATQARTREEQAKLREKQQVERARQQETAKAERLAAQQERERQRDLARAQRDERRQVAARRVARLPQCDRFPSPLRPGAGAPGSSVRPVEVQIRGGDGRHCRGWIADPICWRSSRRSWST